MLLKRLRRGRKSPSMGGTINLFLSSLLLKRPGTPKTGLLIRIGRYRRVVLPFWVRFVLVVMDHTDNPEHFIFPVGMSPPAIYSGPRRTRSDGL